MYCEDRGTVGIARTIKVEASDRLPYRYISIAYGTVSPPEISVVSSFRSTVPVLYIGTYMYHDEHLSGTWREFWEAYT
jgi:hypothetical protein